MLKGIEIESYKIIEKMGVNLTTEYVELGT